MINYPLVFIAEFFIFTCLFVYFSFKANSRAPLWLILILQIIAVALLTKEVGDVMLFSGAGWHLRHKIDYYFIDSDHSMYPFFPFLIFLYAPINLLTEIVPFLTFSFYLKLVLLAALYWLAPTVTNNHRQQLLFLTSPITYCIVLFHGQTDILLLSFLILSLQLLNKKHLFVSALSFAASVAVKTWSALLLPVVLLSLKSAKKMGLFLLSVTAFLFIDVFIYTRYVFGSGFRVVMPAIIKAGGPSGQWGITYLMSFINGFHQWFPPHSLVFFTVLFFLGQWFVFRSKKTLKVQLMIELLLIYLIIPKWCIQYLFWLYPFLYLTNLINHLPLKSAYIVLTGLYLFLNYLNLALGFSLIPASVIFPLGFLLYLLFVYWFYLLTISPAKLPTPAR